MCGITFIADKLSQPVAPGALERSIAAQCHRGPDDSAVFSWENTALGFVRLSIVDLANGRQPFVSEDGSVRLVCNGEIYNYRWLREQLEAKGHRFATMSDCEVILHLYEDEPEAFIEKLAGMFAFVLLDTRRRAVVLGRDRAGIKPLYFADTPENFICASEIKGIARTGLISRELDRQAVYDLFALGYAPGAATCLQNVRTFPPAALGKYSLTEKKLEIREYWQPQFSPAGAKLDLNFRAYFEELRETLSQSVSDHTIGEVPIAAYLSGGIDSTVTTLLLNQNLRHTGRLKAFSIAFADALFDESAIFKRTAEIADLDLAAVNVSAPTAAEFAEAVSVVEQPQMAPLDVPMQKLSGLVRQAGIKVVFSGEGSDELFGGYIQHTLNQIRRALNLPVARPLRPLLLPRILAHYLGSGAPSFLQEFYSREHADIEQRFGTFPAYYPTWFMAGRDRDQIFAGAHQDTLAEGSYLHQTAGPLLKRYRGINDFDKSVLMEFKTRLPNYILPRADKNAMAHSVEVRTPFLSNLMLDFGLKVPPVLKMFGLKEKFILRQAFSGLVPKHVKSRRKFGYNSPAGGIWGRPDALVEAALSPAALAETGLFKPAVVADKLTYLRGVNWTNPPMHAVDWNTVGLMTGVLGTQLFYRAFCK